ncbi:LPS export ABC transporter periplasmic protein LptC [Paracoccus ravus]|uniref:LPS export ABC transporter periplasmic protein LptC n=1 Tax=Paracoccus ravus TaxID=2447760 RepID=UPI00106EB035|nr:LPS export ABC transporter periplasmic protein LptC [Paracoccus ravus]
MLRSRIVAWLRVILPLTALALLSVLFLLGRKPETTPAIPYATVDPQDLAERQAVTAPRYSGVTSNGAQLTIVAAEGEPGTGPDQGRMRDIRVTLRAKDGRAADLSAGTAALDDQSMSLTEGARMTTADGWIVTAPEFHAALLEGRLTADREVNVLAPFGRMTAGGMELRPKAPGDPDHVLDLTGGVRLIYRP